MGVTLNWYAGASAAVGVLAYILWQIAIKKAEACPSAVDRHYKLIRKIEMALQGFVVWPFLLAGVLVALSFAQRIVANIVIALPILTVNVVVTLLGTYLFGGIKDLIKLVFRGYPKPRRIVGALVMGIALGLLGISLWAISLALRIAE